MGPTDLRARALAELTENILPFWAGPALDTVRGGVHGALSDDLVVDDEVDRSAVLCARVLWTFSAAAHGLADRTHLVQAHHAYTYLMAHFIDPVHGGVLWTVDKDGATTDDRKQVYAQAFAVYALAEYARASGLTEPLVAAVRLVDLIEAHTADSVNGGYVEARARDWGPLDDMRLSPRDLNANKSMNTLLHLMEAYTTLLDVTHDPVLRGRLNRLTTVVLDHVVDEKAGTFRLFFDADWRPLSSAVSPGHDIEGTWLLTAAARAAGDPVLVARAERVALTMADAVLRRGRDADGGILYEIRPDGSGAPTQIDHSSHWWAQAEAVVGFLEANRLSGDGQFLEAAESCWDFIEAHHVDRIHGDWFKELEADRRPRATSPKVGPWECPYHHARACLEIMTRLPVGPSTKERVLA
ncbi:MAG: AGE family epimerase/isomerase [Cellulomonas sp.]